MEHTTNAAEPTSQLPKLAYSIPETCKILGVGRTSIYALAGKDKIKISKILKKSVVTKSEIDRVIAIIERDGAI